MGYNYCLVIANKEVVDLVLEVLEKDKVKAELIKKEDGTDLVVSGNSLISYYGRSFPDLEESFPGRTLTLYVDGRSANYEIQGNWNLAPSFNAGITLQMGISLPSADLKKIKRDKKIAAILKELQDLDTFEDLQIEDGVALETHSVTIESENDLSKIEELSQLLEKLSLVLVEMEIDHYVTWFEGTFAQSSGDLYENLLYPVVYADAFWDEDGVEQQLHVTNTEIFCMIS
jgi:hypothetical protein